MRKYYCQFAALLGAIFVTLPFSQITAQGFPGSIRISMQGQDGATNIDAFDPAVAYNATDDEFMVVWSGDTLPSEDEIWAQRINASNGALIGNVIRVSDMGPTGSTTFDAFVPSIAWNSTDNEYLVVWSGDDDTGGLINGENEIFGQRLSSTGAPIGADDFRISFVGGTGGAAFDAFDADVAYNSNDNLYLVAWSGDSLDGEDEIQGQIVSANGTLTGGQLTISNQGPPANTSYDAEQPAIAYNATNNEFMVIWWGDTNVPGEEECFARRLNGTNGMGIDSAHVISDMGPAGNTNYDAATCDVAWNSTANQYLAVWDADDMSAVTTSGENEIFGQLLDNMGTEIGPNDFVISSLGTNLNGQSDAFDPHVVYSPNCNEYMVTYEGDNINGSTVDGEVDCFIARIDPNGTPTGIDSAVTNAGIIGNANWDTGNPALAFSTTSGTYLVVNNGEHNAGMLADGENEIWGILKFCCSAPTYAGMPSTDSVCAGVAGLIYEPSTGLIDSIRWECSVNGGANWTPVFNGATYGGTGSDSLIIYMVMASMDGNQYRPIAYGCGGTSTGPITTISIDPAPPTISCPANITESPTTFDCNPAVSWVPPTPTDNCGSATATGTANPGDNFPVGTTTVTYTATDQAGNTSTCSFDVTVDTPNVSGTITYANGDLCTSLSGVSYQWYLNGNPINGATGQCYVPSSTGNYTVEVTDQNGCTAISEDTLTSVGRPDALTLIPEIFPNPTTGALQIRFETRPFGQVAFQVTDLMGKSLLKAQMENQNVHQLDLSTLPNGIYLLQVRTAEGVLTKKVQVAR